MSNAGIIYESARNIIVNSALGMNTNTEILDATNSINNISTSGGSVTVPKGYHNGRGTRVYHTQMTFNFTHIPNYSSLTLTTIGTILPQTTHQWSYDGSSTTMRYDTLTKSYSNGVLTINTSVDTFISGETFVGLWVVAKPTFFKPFTTTATVKSWM